MSNMSGPQKESSAARILRAALERLTDLDSTVTAGEISSAVMVQTGRQHKRMLNHISDLVKAGKLARVKNGVYRRPDPDGKMKPGIREVMWRLLRMRRAVSIGDLQEMAGASAGYAGEWLRMLEKKGVVRRDDGIWRLLVDQVEMPENDAAAEKYRRIRAARKAEIAAALDDMSEALGRVRQALTEI
jgi:CRP-like cAMP-binding protein